MIVQFTSLQFFNMDRKMNLVLFSLLVLQAIVSIQSQAPSFEHDVTKQMDTWITKILKVNTETMKKLFNRITQKMLEEFEYGIGHEVASVGNKLHFHNVFMNVSEFKSPQINWKFSENKMGIFIKEYTVRMIGKLQNVKNDGYIQFDTHLDLQNISLTLSIDDAEKTSIEFKQDKSWIWFNEELNVVWSGFYLTVNERIELEKVLPTVLEVLLRENFKRNEDLAKSIRTLFKAYSGPKKNIISTHSDFLTNNNKHYYLIPKISFFCFNLKNILIRGLWNLEWLKVNTGLTMFTHTLMIRNVEGNLILDYGSKHEKPLELLFKIDYFSISIDKKSVNIDARCYSVNKTSTPLTYRQSALIMQRIESAVANSLFPTIQNRRTYEIDTPLEQIKIDEQTDWKNIRSQFNEWIPFNDDGAKPPAGSPPGAAAKAPAGSPPGAAAQNKI